MKNIDLEKAVSIIQKKNPILKIRSCSEYDNFFLFSLAPLDVADGDTYVTGTVFPAVDKKTGRVFEYDILSDYDAFEKSKRVI